MKKQIALNKLWNFALLIEPALLLLTYWSFRDNDIGFGIGLLFFSLLCLFGMLIIPCCYIFDSEGVTLKHLFIPSERYLWKNIREIEVDYDPSLTSRSELFDLLFSTKFCIKGTSEGKQRFYMEGEITKSFRTKRLLEKYWDGTITGYWDEDIKKWYRRRKKKKASKELPEKKHIADEVAPMEREARAKVRECVVPLSERAKSMGLEIRIKYLYVTKDGETSRSRPKDEGYTYTAVLDICNEGEIDKDRIVDVSADLIYVRMGREKHRGTYNTSCIEELSGYASDVLDNGIEVYLKSN